MSLPAVFATCTYSSFLFVCFLHDVKNVLKMYRLSSGEELRTFPLDVGSVVGFTGRKRDSEIFYYFTSFLSPGISCLCQRPLENFLKLCCLEEMHEIKGITFSENIYFYERLHNEFIKANLIMCFFFFVFLSYDLSLRPDEGAAPAPHLPRGHCEKLQPFRLPDHPGQSRTHPPVHLSIYLPPLYPSAGPVGKRLGTPLEAKSSLPNYCRCNI